MSTKEAPNQRDASIVDAEAHSSTARPSEMGCRFEPGAQGAMQACGCGSDCAAGGVCLSETLTGTPQGACAWSCELDTDCPNEAKCAGAGLERTVSCETDDDCELRGSTCQDGLCHSGGVCTSSCTTDADCGLGRQCTQGICTAACRSDDDCLNRHCNTTAGLCENDNVDTDGTVGGPFEPCLQDVDCASNLCLAPPLARVCAPSVCAAGEPRCPNGQECRQPAGGSESWCVPPCSVDEDCAPQTHCSSAYADGLGCFPDRTCEPRDGRAGDRCQCDEHCPGGYCADETISAWPGGYCLVPCDGTACGADEICQDDVCLPSCQRTADCADGRICMEGGCMPRCFEDSDCDVSVCHEPTGACGLGFNFGSSAGSACSSDEECDSNQCVAGLCYQICSTDRPNCPEGTRCEAALVDLGICVPHEVDAGSP